MCTGLEVEYSGFGFVFITILGIATRVGGNYVSFGFWKGAEKLAFYTTEDIVMDS